MALKGILKKSKSNASGSAAAAAEAGPSKPRTPKQASKPKATVKASMAVPAKSKGKETKAVKVAKPASDDEADAEESDVDMDDGLDTEDEIERAQAPGEKKPLKRKRVTTASVFGATLTSLLTEPAKATKKTKRTGANADGDDEIPLTKLAGQPILSLSAKPLPPSQAAVSLERRAARVLKAQREERLDRARVRNVLEGWTPAPGAEVGSQEFERALRKTAQRGVIKLFNAILIASKNAEVAAKTLSEKAGLKPEAPKSKKEKDNIIGRGGREDVLTKESFLDLVRKGGSK